jgi:hypothetical protein
MRYQTATALTPRQALEQAITDFGPGGVGLQITSQAHLGPIFQQGGGHIAVTAQPGTGTTLALETSEWGWAVQLFMARVHWRHPWWQRWGRRMRPGHGPDQRRSPCLITRKAPRVASAQLLPPVTARIVSAHGKTRQGKPRSRWL